VTRRHDPSRRVHSRTEVIALAFVGFADVETHPDPKSDPGRPALGRERRLRGKCPADRVAGRVEPCSERISGRREHIPIERGDRRSEELVVTLKREAHLIGVLFPEACRPLDIGEQERHRPGGVLSHPPSFACLLGDLPNAISAQWLRAVTATALRR